MPLIVNAAAIAVKTAVSVEPRVTHDPLTLSKPMIVKSEEKIEPIQASRRAVSETIVSKSVVKPVQKKQVRHSDFMMDMTTIDI